MGAKIKDSRQSHKDNDSNGVISKILCMFGRFIITQRKNKYYSEFL